MRIPRSDQLPVGVPDHKSGILRVTRIRVTRIRAFNNAIFIQNRFRSSGLLSTATISTIERNNAKISMI